MTVPNLLTLSRLAALPGVITLSRAGRPAWAAGLFLAAMLTDCFDGWLARRLDQRSALGLYLDPVVDKIVVLVLFYELAHQGVITIAVPHLFLARELLQNGVRAAAASRGTVVGANWMGKTKAVLQTAVLFWGLLLPASGPAVAVASWVVLLLSWGFLFTFLVWNRRLIVTP
jgi:CDP-diacylglycerol--glycerol-3-phosphate 3-phosphatidyltransferase